VQVHHTVFLDDAWTVSTWLDDVPGFRKPSEASPLRSASTSLTPQDLGKTQTISPGTDTDETRGVGSTSSSSARSVRTGIFVMAGCVEGPCQSLVVFIADVIISPFGDDRLLAAGYVLCHQLKSTLCGYVDEAMMLMNSVVLFRLSLRLFRHQSDDPIKTDGALAPTMNSNNYQPRGRETRGLPSRRGGSFLEAPELY
jgi:hypothetical protein